MVMYGMFFHLYMYIESDEVDQIEYDEHGYGKRQIEHIDQFTLFWLNNMCDDSVQIFYRIYTPDALFVGSCLFVTAPAGCKF